MRIAICTTQVPFVSGGAESLAQNLRVALLQHHHEVAVVTLPFKWYPPYDLLQSILLWQLVDLEEVAERKVDLVIGLKFPAYLVKHSNKVLWILHQHRQAYDLWDTQFSDLRHTREGAKLREIINQVDSRVFREVRHVFTISQTVTKRLKHFNGIDAPTLYHPPPFWEPLESNNYHDYVFCPSRLDPLKRQSLLIEAMAHVKSGATCILAGSGPDEPVLRKLIRSHGLEARVSLLGRVPDDQVRQLYSNALAVFFGPLNEDYGYVTLEAFLAAKAVITLTDSGGPLEFVEDGANGFIVFADPREIAKKIDLLFVDRRRAQQLGERGRAMLVERNINWSNVVRRLTS
jgi:glycosyltransferase involved in cell wall biosynthesis